jgi:hypothetical protein
MLLERREERGNVFGTMAVVYGHLNLLRAVRVSLKTLILCPDHILNGVVFGRRAQKAWRELRLKCFSMGGEARRGEKTAPSYEGLIDDFSRYRSA